MYCVHDEDEDEDEGEDEDGWVLMNNDDLL
jgi:hypothetical protein